MPETRVVLERISLNTARMGPSPGRRRLSPYSHVIDSCLTDDATGSDSEVIIEALEPNMRFQHTIPRSPSTYWSPIMPELPGQHQMNQQNQR